MVSTTTLLVLVVLALWGHSKHVCKTVDAQPRNSGTGHSLSNLHLLHAVLMNLWQLALMIPTFLLNQACSQCMLELDTMGLSSVFSLLNRCINVFFAHLSAKSSAYTPRSSSASSICSASFDKKSSALNPAKHPAHVGVSATQSNAVHQRSSC